MLFDVDGTLVDSNYLHVYAWTRAFAGGRHRGRVVADPSLDRDGRRQVDRIPVGRRRRRRAEAGRGVAYAISQGGRAAFAASSRRARTSAAGVARSVCRSCWPARRVRTSWRCHAACSTATIWCRPQRPPKMSTSPSRTRRSSRSRWKGRAWTPITPSMSATRSGMSLHAVVPVCPPSGCSAEACHGRNSKRPALKPYSRIRVTSAHTSAAPRSARWVS